MSASPTPPEEGRHSCRPTLAAEDQDHTSSILYPRPIYRWKTLWLGILALTFLAWAWWQSTQAVTAIRYHRHAITHAGSGISIARWADGSVWAPPFWWTHQTVFRASIWKHPRIEPPRFFRRTPYSEQYLDYLDPDPSGTGHIPRTSAAGHFQPFLSGGGTGSWAIYIPHWLIILLFLIPWATLLIWRHRRIRHLTAGSAEPPARSST